MTAYKDDLEAAHERIRALEHELVRAKGEDERPARPAGPPLPVPRPLGSALSLSLLLLPLFLGAGLLARNPRVEILIVTGWVYCLILLAVIRRLLVVGRTCEALVQITRPRPGSASGFRVTVGGRVIRLPLVGRVDRMDLRARSVSWSVKRVRGQDGSSLSVHGYLHFGIGTAPDMLHRAATRWLGKGPEELDRLAQEQVTNAVRSVTVRLDAGGLRSRLPSFCDEVENHLGPGMEELGLELLGLGILEVSTAPAAEVRS